MFEGTLIAGIAIAVVVSLFITAAAQRQQKVEQAKRLKVAKLRHKANQIQDLLDWLNKHIGEPTTASILADIVISLMEQMREVDPKITNIDQNIRHLKEISENPPPKQTVKPPPNNAELNSQVGKVKRIIDMITKMSQGGTIPAMRANTANQELLRIYYKTLIDGHIKLGRDAYNKQQVGSAIQHFSFAQEKLLKCNLDEAEVAEKTKIIQDHIHQMTQLRQEAQEAEQKAKEQAEQEAKEKAKAKANADPTKGDTTVLGDSDALFSEKKKW